MGSNLTKQPGGILNVLREEGGGAKFCIPGACKSPAQLRRKSSPGQRHSTTVGGGDTKLSNPTVGALWGRRKTCSYANTQTGGGAPVRKCRGGCRVHRKASLPLHKYTIFYGMEGVSTGGSPGRAVGVGRGTVQRPSCGSLTVDKGQ